jgi:outer membrane translocation and assembly module TamA
MYMPANAFFVYLKNQVQRYLIVLVFFSLKLHAQNNLFVPVKFYYQFSPETQEPSQLPQTILSDSQSISNTINEIILKLNGQGFLAANVSSETREADTTYITISVGAPYRWIALRKGDVIQEAITGSGFREKDFEGKTFSPDKYAMAANAILNYLERNGYPFATLKLDSLSFDSNTIEASWNLELNGYTIFDTIELIGDANIKKWYLQKYLNIKNGNPYNEQSVKRFDNRLSQLPFITVSRNSSLYFYGNKAKPILFVQNRNANNIDGIIGFAPNTQLNDGSLLVTGEANLKLQNLFASGKSVDLNFRSFMGNSQELKFKFVFPYLFKSNVGIDYDLNLLKQDTTFLDVRNTIGLQYRIIGEDYVRFFYSVQSTTSINVDTNFILQNKTLPDAVDLVNFQYGMSLKLVHYDYYINPRKGFGIDFTGSVGVKNIERNPTIDALILTSPDGNTYSIYDSLALRMVQYSLQGDMDWFVPIYKLLVSRVQLKGGQILAPQLFSSELFRIGGIRSLKGFDEQVIFASSYIILNTEIRYLIQRNAHVLLFWNGAYYRNEIRTPVIADTPFGFGAGLNFETGNGLFSLFYAIGSEQNNPINFSAAKVHFGYTNYF